MVAVSPPAPAGDIDILIDMFKVSAPLPSSSSTSPLLPVRYKSISCFKTPGVHPTSSPPGEGLSDLVTERWREERVERREEVEGKMSVRLLVGHVGELAVMCFLYFLFSFMI